MNASTPPEQDVAAPGERLRKAREALSLSREEIARRIRIKPERVAALEEGDIERVGAPVFAAGYIRAYARIVDLPADELIPQFAGLGELASPQAPLAEAPVQPRVEDPLPRPLRLGGPRAGQRIRRAAIPLLVLLALGTGAWLARGIFTDGDRNAPAEAPPAVVSGKALPIPGREEMEEAMDGEAVDGGSVPDADVVREAEPEPDEAPVPDRELHLGFTDDSWVEVTDATGQRLLHRLGRAGSSHTVRGVPPFAVVLGYVPGVMLLLDGEPVDLSRYQGRRLARLSVGGETTDEN